jgi:hypothetical protein
MARRHRHDHHHLPDQKPERTPHMTHVLAAACTTGSWQEKWLVVVLALTGLVLVVISKTWKGSRK